jgi:hypothetical protein
MSASEELLRELLAKAQQQVEWGVVAAMVQDIDVTDDVAGREAYFALHQGLGPKRGDFTDAAVDVFTPETVLRIASIAAKRIRRAATFAVAAALDGDPRATEQSVTEFVRSSLVTEFGPSSDRYFRPAAVLFARAYSAMLRASGLTPDKWVAAFDGLNRGGHWAFRRR